MTDVIEYLDPAAIAQHPDNVRDASRGLDELAASIAEVGVLVPLIVVPVEATPFTLGEEITHVAVDGNRRQAAALRVGVKLPCLVRPDLAAAREAAMTMAVTGLVRDGFTVAEEVHATQIMLDLGIDLAAVARATARPVERVELARTAAGLKPSVAESAYEHEVTLEDLAAIAEFQDDAKATKAIMTSIERGYGTDHEVVTQRRKRQVAELVAQHTEELTGKGLVITKTQPKRGTWDTSLKAIPLEDLQSPEGKKITALTHRRCEGHAVYLKETVWSTPPTVERVYVCLDPDAHGHVYTRARQDTPEETAEREAHEERVALLADVRQVRVEFLHTQFARKDAPREMLEWALARAAYRDIGDFTGLTDRHWRDTQRLAPILGIEYESSAAVRDWIQRQPPTRTAALLWAAAAAAADSELEYAIEVNVVPSTDVLLAYLDHLQELGYTLSEIETEWCTAIRERRAAEAEERAVDEVDDDAVAD